MAQVVTLGLDGSKRSSSQAVQLEGHALPLRAQHLHSRVLELVQGLSQPDMRLRCACNKVSNSMACSGMPHTGGPLRAEGQN